MMRRSRKRLAVLALAAFLPFLLSGCWDYREIESLTLVSGVAIDPGYGGKLYHITFECVQINGDQKGGSTQPWVIEADGDTVFEAERDALQVSEKKLYFNPCRVVVLSEELAREGIRPVLDWFLRDAEPRITMEFVVSRAATASEILKQQAQTGQLNAYIISDLIRGTTDFSGEVAQTRLYKINNILNADDGLSLILPGVKVSETSGEAKLKMCGTSVFRDDCLIGWLDDDQTEFLNFIRNRISEGLIITSDSSDNGKISLEILKSHTSVKPEVEGDSVQMKIGIHVETAMGERQSHRDLPGEESIANAEREAEKTLTKGICSLVSEVQTRYGSDIFGFGDVVHKQNPEAWKKLQPVWNEVFRHLTCEPDVTVQIQNTALVNEEKDEK